MSTTPDPPIETGQQGISLDELARAFSQLMEPGSPRSEERSVPSLGGAGFPPGGTGVPPVRGSDFPEAADTGGTPVPPGETALPSDALQSPLAEDPCPINPRTIFEAMLFVGDRENRPLTPARAAELMRDVSVDEIPPLVDDLNRRYAAAGAPYRVIGAGDGYRLALREEYRSLRDRFYGRIREARLSQAAIDVLALVAYGQPITGEKIGRLRGKPSSHILAHLVRRGLLRIERPEANRRTPHYLTTDRFLRLFNLESLADLPKSEDDAPL